MNAEAKQGPRPLSPARSRELQDPLNRWLYHPLSAGLARLLLPGPVSPNMVSIGGGLLICAAAVAYVGLAWPVAVLAGLALHMSWHVVDGADGDLARLRGGGSPLGELIDGVSDYLGHVVLYVTLAAVLAATMGGWAWALAAGAGLSRIAQSNHIESQRRAYLWWAYDVPWLRHARADGDALFQSRHPLARIFVPLVRLYLRLAGATAPHIARVDAALRRGDADPAARPRVRRLMRGSAKGLLLLQHWLGPNPRTILLGLSMIATGRPTLFFLIELVPLNLLLLVSILRSRQLAARLSLVLEPRQGGQTI